MTKEKNKMIDTVHDISQEIPTKAVERIQTYDEIFKEYLQNLSDSVVVSFINSMFNKNFPINSEVTRLNKESVTENKSIFSDLYISIEEEMFHLEAQTRGDKQMALRMFEYGFYGAYQHDRTETEDGIKLKFPSPVVIYFKTDNNTPEKLKIELELPDGETAEFRVPTMNIKDFTVKDISEKSLYPIAAFYAFKHFGSKESKAFKKDIKEVCEALKTAEKKGLLKPSEAGDLIDKTLDIAKRVTVQNKLPDEKEVLEFMNSMEKVMVRDTLGVYKEGEEKGIRLGIEKGIEKGKINAVRTLHEMNLPMEKIFDFAKKEGISKSEVYAMLKIQPAKETEKPSLVAKVKEKQAVAAKTPRKKAATKKQKL